jgi:hypothetical protein
MPKLKIIAIWVAMIAGGILTFLMYGWAADLMR